MAPRKERKCNNRLICDIYLLFTFKEVSCYIVRSCVLFLGFQRCSCHMYALCHSRLPKPELSPFFMWFSDVTSVRAWRVLDFAAAFTVRAVSYTHLKLYLAASELYLYPFLQFLICDCIHIFYNFVYRYVYIFCKCLKRL